MKWCCSMIGMIVVEAETRDEAAEAFFQLVKEGNVCAPVAFTAEEYAARIAK